MANQSYQIADEEPMTVCEPAVAYRIQATETDPFNPNFPGHCTQEEFMKHIHRIEKWEFMSFEEYKNKFNAWKKEFLSSRMK